MKILRRIAKSAIHFALSPFIIADYCKFKNRDDRRFPARVSDFYPQLRDKTIKTGFDRHYVYHTSWAARAVKDIAPSFHTDISSSLYFSGIVSAFVPVKFYDYRPADLRLNNLSSESADLMNLPFEDGSVHSLSCMHVVEHIGLGRYGDPIDPEGDLKAIAELRRVLARGGSLLFVVPVGKPRIQFNAHRIYSFEMVREYFSDLNLKEFALIPERQGAMMRDASAERVSQEQYGCGCFWFIKPL
jgi:SAM-dependent methyltransferase